MSINTFYKAWGTARAIVLMALILIVAGCIAWKMLS